MAIDRTPEAAEARQKKKAQQLVDGQKAMLEYEAGLKAMREKTERLRALRLAHEEAAAKAAAEAAPTKKKSAKKSPKSKAGTVDVDPPDAELIESDEDAEVPEIVG